MTVSPFQRVQDFTNQIRYQTHLNGALADGHLSAEEQATLRADFDRLSGGAKTSVINQLDQLKAARPEMTLELERLKWAFTSAGNSPDLPIPNTDLLTHQRDLLEAAADGHLSTEEKLLLLKDFEKLSSAGKTSAVAQLDELKAAHPEMADELEQLKVVYTATDEKRQLVNEVLNLELRQQELGANRSYRGSLDRALVDGRFSAKEKLELLRDFDQLNGGGKASALAYLDELKATRPELTGEIDQLKSILTAASKEERHLVNIDLQNQLQAEQRATRLVYNVSLRQALVNGRFSATEKVDLAQAYDRLDSGDQARAIAELDQLKVTRPEMAGEIDRLKAVLKGDRQNLQKEVFLENRSRSGRSHRW